MELLEFSMYCILTVGFYAIYKGTTFKKSMTLYIDYHHEIINIDCSQKIKNILFLLNDESVKSLFFIKSLMGLFFYKKSKKIMMQFSTQERDLLTKYTINAIKTYLTYAPHWVLIIGIIGIIVSFFAFLFGIMDKLKNVFLMSIENRFIVH